MSDSSEPTKQVDEPVFRLMYKSHSKISPERRTAELGAIFTSSRRNNQRLGISGALMISDDAFVQALEGDEHEVRELYGIICEDLRHEGFVLLEAQPVQARTFGRWAMAKVAAEGGPDIRLLSNARKRTIVSAGHDHHITPEQETVLAFMRGTIAQDISARTGSESVAAGRTV